MRSNVDETPQGCNITCYITVSEAGRLAGRGPTPYQCHTACGTPNRMPGNTGTGPGRHQCLKRRQIPVCRRGRPPPPGSCQAAAQDAAAGSCGQARSTPGNAQQLPSVMQNK
jgi:hypothetical protein